MTTAVCLALSSSATISYAEQEKATTYFDNFIESITLDSISDYAVYGDNYAFADGMQLKIVERKDDDADYSLTVFDCGFELAYLDYSDDNLYIGDTSGNAYIYPDLANKTLHNFTYPTQVSDSFHTYYLATKTQRLYCLDDEMTEIGEGFSLLKIYDGVAYAVKGNCLYTLNGGDANIKDVEYVDFEKASTIESTYMYAKLKNLSSPYLVTLKKGAYCTRIDLDETQGVYFKEVSTFKLSGDRSAQVIATDGNAAVVLMADGQYIFSYLTMIDDSWDKSATSATILDGTAKMVVVNSTYLYTAPYKSEATKINQIASDTPVTLNEELNFSNGAKYYKVSYTNEDGVLVSGYIDANFLSAYSYPSDTNVETTIKGEEDYTTNVEKVILVLMIVALVIVAIAYLTIVGTRNKKSKQKPKETRTLPPEE
jgi:hypothetical protein